MKLYEVEIDMTMYVLAEDEASAENVARLNAGEEAGNLHNSAFCAVEVGTFACLDWLNMRPYRDEDCEDFDGLGDMTVKEILAEMGARREEKARREEFEKKQFPLFPSA